MIIQHPPILCYRVDSHLRPIVDYLTGEVAVGDVRAVLIGRPSILGLDVDLSLRKIVGWLKDNEYAQEDIVKYLTTSI